VSAFDPQVRVCWVLAVSLVWLGAGAQAARARTDDPAAEPAKAVVRETVDAVIEVLATPNMEKEARIRAIQEITYERFDFETMSRLVLARNYKKFSPDERGVFVTEFKGYLSRSYGARLDRYAQEKVDLLRGRLEPRGDVTVYTRIVGGQNDGIEVSYRLRARDDVWMVIDVVIEGVSLVANYRSQFKEVVNEGGPRLLLEKLKDKNVQFEEPD
jgi:phospholipid transport system substrate-binding protein